MAGGVSLFIRYMGGLDLFYHRSFMLFLDNVTIYYLHHQMLKSTLLILSYFEIVLIELYN